MHVHAHNSITCRPSYAMRNRQLKNERLEELFFFYAIPCSFWPTDGLSTSLEGSVIEMKFTTLIAPQVTAVSL